MKTRNFILSFLMMMFCSVTFGQNWGDFNYHNYPNHMTVNAVISIDGQQQSNPNLTIAPYYGDERRGEPIPAISTIAGHYMAEVLIYGETDGETITFKLFDGEYMYDNLADYSKAFEADAVYGDLRNPVNINFKSVAKVGDKKYGKLQVAVNAAEGKTVEVINDVTLKEAVVVANNTTIDFGNKAITANVYPAFRIQGNANVTVKNGNITNNDYVFVLGASDGSSAGNLTIESGKYVGEVTVASVTKGLLTIKGGEFNLQNVGQYGYTYLINCIDNNYPSSANVVVTGGKFYGFNPENNAAEGANTNFCAEGYIASEYTENGVKYYIVEEGGWVAQNTTTGVKYKTLQAAIDACAAGNNTIVLLAEVNEDVTVVQAPNTKVTIDGANKNYTGTITVNGKSAAYETAALNIVNVNFDTKNITKEASINLGISGNNNTRYTNNVTVEGCSFVGTGQTKAGIKNYTGGCKNLVVSNCTTDGLHSLVQVKGIEGITVANVTIKNGKNGIAVGTSTNVNIKGSTINVTGYGVRADGTGACNMTLAENTIEANLPIVVREAKGAYNLTVESGSYKASNEKGAAVTFTTGDDGTFEAPTSDATATLAEGISTFGFEARIGQVHYTTFDKAYAAAKEGDAITVINPVVVAETKAYDLTGLTVAGENVYPIFRIQNGATMTVENANITNNDYVFVLGASDGSSAGNLVINGGSYKGETTVASVTKGLLTINGGEFSLSSAYENNYNFLINCIDANYKDGTAKVEIKGGKFYSFNPEDNAAEGAGTDFCPEGYTTIYDATEDSYTVINAVAKIGETYYATLSSAIAAVKNGETIEFIANINENVTIKQTANKSFTIDGDGQTYTGTITVNGNKRSTGAETLTIKNVNFVAEGQWQSSILASKNTYVHNVTVDACTFTGTDAKEVYGIRLYSSYNITVKNTTGTKLYDLVYAQTAVDGFVAENITVTESANGFWFPYGKNPSFKNITISETAGMGIGISNNNSGTATFENCNISAGTAIYLGEYNDVTKSYQLIFNGTNTFGENWLVVEGTTANFKVVVNDEGLDMTKTSGLVAYEGNKYYNTLAYAVKDAAANVTVLKDHEITKTAVVEKDMTIDFAGLAITGNVFPVVRVQKDADVTVMNGNINNNDYVFVLGASDASTAGNLTIENGLYTGTVSVASVTKGTLAIEGGVFRANDSEYGAQYLINCIDANYPAEANVSITGGTFFGFDPENNAAEGAGTNFCAEGYLSVDNGDGSYTVRKGEYVAEIKGGAKYESLQAAINAAVDGDEVVMLSDLAYSWENVVKTNDNRPVLAYVEGKEITLNMNEKKISVVHQSTLEEERIFAVVCVEENASLTVTGNGTIDVDTDADNVYEAEVTPKVAYMFWKRGTTGYMTIENGNYHMDDAEDSMVYSNGDETITVEGGTFVLEAVGTRTNGFPYIFNAAGNNQRSVKVVGGTYNYDIRTQHWSLEVYIPNGYALRDNGDGTWTVIAAVAYISDENGNKVTYASLTEANAAALAGQTITLLANVTENVTFTKNLTIDGDEFEYTGQMTLNKVNVTIKNVNFVKGNVYKAKSTTGGNYTIQNCTFDGQGLNRYAVELRNTNNIVIENVTAKDYGYGFLQIPSANVSLSIKNVEISDVNYGLKIDYSNGVTLENVVITDAREFGMWVSNYSSRTYNIKNCEINSIEIHERYYDEAETNPYTNNITFKFTGANKVGALDNQYAKYVLNAVDATLAAPAGHDVKSGKADYVVAYEGGVYKLIPGSVLNETQNKRYATIQDAIDASNAGDVIKLLDNVNYGKNDMFAAEVYGYTVMVNATGKNIVLDLNGYTISTDLEDCTELLYAVVFVGDNGSITFRDSSVAGTGTIIAKAGLDADGKGNIYSLLMADTKATQNVKMYIESGNYELDESRDSGALVYVNISNILTVTGGNFYLGNAGTLANNSPWIFNTYKNGVNHVIVKGGNYNVTPLHYHGEVVIPAEYTVVEIEDDKYHYSVVPAQRQNLEAGWTWFSSYIADFDGEEGLNMLKSSLGNNGEQIKNQLDAINYQYYNGEYYWVGENLKEVSVTEMYMIKTTAEVELVLGGDIANPEDIEIALQDGWTWIGYPVATSMNLEDALENITPNDGDIIKSQDGIAQYYAEWNTWYSQSLTSMTPGMGYMYRNTSGSVKEFTYPTPNANTRAAVKANVTAENNRWVPNASAFANNMNIIAVLESNDMMGEFEVAAFVNGEVRGSARPTYVEPIDAYVLFMTIYGEEGEEMTFKYYDIYSDEEHVISNTVAYSDNAVIGSIKEPYMFFANTLGMEENAASALSIYPNPTTTNAAISFDTVYDMVEVFNALGSKVAEYSNVDRIEGMEAAGVYVIRVTNDNAVQNCRLIVK